MSNLTAEDWKARAAALSPRTEAFIAGDFAPAASGKTYDSINPATGVAIAQVAACDAVDVNRAVAAARDSFESGVWAEAHPAHRKSVLLRLAELMRADAEQLALLISLDMGKLVSEALFIEVPIAADALQWHAEAIDKVYGEIAPSGPGELALVTREAIGVVGAIMPWNFPLNLTMWKLAPALAAGNSVVLKPSRQTPLYALRLAELAAEAGLPSGVLNVVPGIASAVGEPLALHMDVDCLVFTGSTAVAKSLLRYSSESNMKRVWLEAGGKSPNLVFADCGDLEAAAAATAGNIFFNQGAVCSANSRLLVQREIKDEFVAMIAERSTSIRPGDPLDPESTMGALVDVNHTETVLDYIAEGKQQARLIAGGNQTWINGSGCYVEPTIFDDTPPDARIVREEIFGPVLAVMAFDTEDEGVALANSSIYGLAASVWTDNLSRAHRVSRKLRAGTVSVNTVDAISNGTPFGGMKQSGNGRDLSLHSFDKYTELKTTWIKF